MFSKWAVLCCVVLCCVVFCCVVLCCAVLCCVVLCCVVLCYMAPVGSFIDSQVELQHTQGCFMATSKIQICGWYVRMTRVNIQYTSVSMYKSGHIHTYVCVYIYIYIYIYIYERKN